MMRFGKTARVLSTHEVAWRITTGASNNRVNLDLRGCKVLKLVEHGDGSQTVTLKALDEDISEIANIEARAIQWLTSLRATSEELACMLSDDDEVVEYFRSRIGPGSTLLFERQPPTFKQHDVGFEFDLTILLAGVGTCKGRRSLSILCALCNATRQIAPDSPTWPREETIEEDFLGPDASTVDDMKNEMIQEINVLVKEYTDKALVAQSVATRLEDATLADIDRLRAEFELLSSSG
jgi:hypothetical protein